jgi:hypothetical protein
MESDNESAQSTHSDDDKNPLLALLEEEKGEEAYGKKDPPFKTESAESSDSDDSIEDEDATSMIATADDPKDYSKRDIDALFISQLQQASSNTMHSIRSTRKRTDTIRPTRDKKNLMLSIYRRDLWPCPLSDGILPGPPRPLSYMANSHTLEDFDDDDGEVKIRYEGEEEEEKEGVDDNEDPSQPLRVEIERVLLQEEIPLDEDETVEEKIDDSIDMMKKLLHQLVVHRVIGVAPGTPINTLSKENHRRKALTGVDVIRIAREVRVSRKYVFGG